MPVRAYLTPAGLQRVGCCVVSTDVRALFTPAICGDAWTLGVLREPPHGILGVDHALPPAVEEPQVLRGPALLSAAQGLAPLLSVDHKAPYAELRCTGPHRGHIWDSGGCRQDDGWLYLGNCRRSCRTTSRISRRSGPDVPVFGPSQGSEPEVRSAPDTDSSRPCCCADHPTGVGHGG